MNSGCFFGRYAIWLVFSMVLTFSASALSDESSSESEMDGARNTAARILQDLQKKKFSDVWENDVSNWFKNNATKPAFMGNMTVIHNQLGGQSFKRELIQQGKADGDSATGYVGDVFSFMYQTEFPRAKVYETIYLVVEAGTYKLAGINYIPNPN
jgi:hypothetical protein